MPCGSVSDRIGIRGDFFACIATLVSVCARIVVEVASDEDQDAFTRWIAPFLEDDPEPEGQMSLDLAALGFTA